MKQSTLNTTTRHCLALCALVFCTLSLPAQAARLAAVIGNDQYEHHSKLRKAGNDADAMAALLKRSGFTVVNENLRRDLSRAQMNQVFSQLVQKVRRDDEVVVFYSGHGLQYGDSSVITGKDFPKPFDRTLALSEGIQLKAWQEIIRRAGARFALFVVDACREDITEDGLVKSMTGEDALFRTMEPTNPPEGQMVIFSARSGQLALDRLSNADPNPNGVFTRVFLEEAQKPGVSILDVVGETEERVAQLAATVKDRQTGQPHRQKPALRNEAGQRVKFCFVPNNGQCGEPGPIPAPRAAVNPEQEAWDLAKRSHSALAYQAYASAYPQGRYAQAAQVALEGFRPVQIASIKPEPVAQQVQLPAPVQSPAPRPVTFSAGQVFRDCQDAHCPEMVVIPGGSFEMGSNEDSDEKPIHSVNIRSFALGKYEVTQGQWKAVMGSNPSFFSSCGDNCPVEQVSWNDIQQYIQKLNQKTGQRYRLPSEAEWEYAARAGSSGMWSFGSDVSQLHQHAWYKSYYSSRASQTHPVGQKQINGFGLHDMHGNVWEWVQDWYQDNYNAAPTDGSAWETGGKQERRVLRGGSWDYIWGYLRSAARLKYTPDLRFNYIGFRLARTAP